MPPAEPPAEFGSPHSQPQSRFGRKKRISPRTVLVALGILILLTAVYRMAFVKKSPEEAGGKRAMLSKMGVNVTTATASVVDLPVNVETIGTVEAFETVAVLPRVGGQLMKIHFQQGDLVKAGQLLFEIDPSVPGAAAAQARSVLAQDMASVSQARQSYNGSQAQVSTARANLKRDEASLSLARLQEVRYRHLLDKNYVTVEQYLQMKTALETAQATVGASKAAVQNAQAQARASQTAIVTSQASADASRAALQSANIQLGFTQIRSPITGKTGPFLVYEGNIVQPNTSTLVNIARVNPIRVVFSVPERYLPDIQKAMPRASTANAMPVFADIPMDSAKRDGATAIKNSDAESAPIPYLREKGRLVFVDNTVDANSGTVRLKGEFPNERHNLWPGRFVNVHLQMGIEKQALTVPVKAVQTSQDGDFVYIVDGTKKARKQLVTVARVMADKAVIEKGIQVGDVVVIDGASRLSPGMKVITGKKGLKPNDEKGDIVQPGLEGVTPGSSERDRVKAPSTPPSTKGEVDDASPDKSSPDKFGSGRR